MNSKREAENWQTIIKLRAEIKELERQLKDLYKENSIDKQTETYYPGKLFFGANNEGGR